jgi:ATP-binding cassette, subfamily B (MDR/TAP), member 1
MTFFVMFAAYGLAFWYGSVLINQAEITAGEVVTVFFAVIFGAMALGQGAPNLAAFAAARGAAYKIFETIDRVPIIDTLSDEGVKPGQLDGNISFEGVRFHYPMRPGVPVLQGLDVTIKSGQTVALVGPSGCGKSTTVGLLQRFYDPSEGIVRLDGVDIRTVRRPPRTRLSDLRLSRHLTASEGGPQLSVKWLRAQIGVVSQEPVLFNKTIGENIRMGKPEATQAEVEDAARAANAHDFIAKLPKGYDTMVGERGAQVRHARTDATPHHAGA